MTYKTPEQGGTMQVLVLASGDFEGGYLNY